MPIFIASLLGGLVQVASSLVGRVLLALGIGYVTYQGLDFALAQIGQLIFANFSSVPSQVLGVMSHLQIGAAINIQLSAVAARLVLNGLTSGAVTKMVIK